MKLLISPNSFKGTCTAKDMATVISKTLADWSMQANVSLSCRLFPIADGGDDTLAVLQANQPNEWQGRRETVMGPLPDMTVQANYLSNPSEKLAVIEAAQAHGLAILMQSSVPLQALAATSYGVGQLMHTAYQAQTDQLIVTLGGSASTDGGLGALQALGIRFLDKAGQPLTSPITPACFPKIDTVCPHFVQTFLANWQRVQCTVLTDVTSPLLGKQGTAYTFAPQKGASPNDCQYLETELDRLADLLAKAFGQDNRNIPGAGAAGGLGYGLLHLPNVSVQSGFSWLSATLGLEQAVQSVDVIMTGEGRFDATSLSGKATGEILALANQYGKRVILLCGSIDAQVLDKVSSGSILPLDLTRIVPVDEAMAKPETAIRKTLLHHSSALQAFLQG